MTSARFGPLWLLAAAVISGLAVIGVGHVRSGGFVVAGALFAAALLRLIHQPDPVRPFFRRRRRPPPGRAGGLVVRSRLADVTFLFGMGVALFVIVVALDLRPRG